MEDRVPLVDLGDWKEERREGAPGLGPPLWSGDLPMGTRGRNTSVTLGCVFLWAQDSGGRLGHVELAQKPGDWSGASPGARQPSLLSLCTESIFANDSTERQRGFLPGCFWGAAMQAEPMKDGQIGGGQNRAAGSGCSQQARSATLPPPTLPLSPQLYQSIVWSSPEVLGTSLATVVCTVACWSCDNAEAGGLQARSLYSVPSQALCQG